MNFAMWIAFLLISGFIFSCQSKTTINLNESNSTSTDPGVPVSDGSSLTINATLAGAPTGIQQSTVLNVTVAGAYVALYSYKVGLGAGDCGISTGYSGFVTVSTLITADISGLTDGTITLCVIGRDAGGSNTQAMSSATTATWTKDTTGPAAPTGISLGGVTSNMGATPTIDWSGDATDIASSVVGYQVQIRKSSDSSVHQDWSTVSKGAVYTLPVNNPLVMTESYTLRVRGVDSLGNFGAASDDSSSFTVNNIIISAFSGSAPDIANAHAYGAGSGYFYIYGGINNSYNAWLDINHFISPSDTWATPTGVPALLAAPYRRHQSSIVWVKNLSAFFIYGGSNEDWSPVRTDVHTYNPTTGAWAAGTDLKTDLPSLNDPGNPAQHLSPSRVKLFSDGDSVYFWGGRIRGDSQVYGYSNYLLKYDFNANPRWQQLATAPANVFNYYSHSAFGGNKLIAISAYQDGSFNFLPVGAIYDVVSNQWQSITFGSGGAPSNPLVEFSLVVDDQRNVAYLYGGFEPICDDVPAINCEASASDLSKYNTNLYSINLNTGVWTILTPNGTMPSHLSQHSATWANNVMIVFGGMVDWPSYAYYNSIYAYYPQQNRWVTLDANPSEAMLSRRFVISTSNDALGGVALFDQVNKIMVYGGFGNNAAGAYIGKLNTGASILLPF